MDTKTWGESQSRFKSPHCMIPIIEHSRESKGVETKKKKKIRRKYQRLSGAGVGFRDWEGRTRDQGIFWEAGNVLSCCESW